VFIVPTIKNLCPAHDGSFFDTKFPVARGQHLATSVHGQAFTVTLSATTGATLGANKTETVTIRKN
jgi:hypothetical protein